MFRRCYDPDDRYYYLYGARGITLCPAWLEAPRSFVRWALDNGYQPGLVLDRIDNEGPYSPENCRWVTAAESSRNRRNTLRFLYNGELRTTSEIAELTGLAASIVKGRMLRGTSLEAPAREHFPAHSFIWGGKRYTTKEVAAIHGITPCAVRLRVRAGWSDEKIINTPGKKR